MTPAQIAFVHGDRPLPSLEYGNWGINLWGRDGELVQSFPYPGSHGGFGSPVEAERTRRAAREALFALAQEA